jgi:hypothetical protein
MTAVSDGNVTHAPTTEDLVARVREVQPLLAAKSAQGESDRRVAEESIAALTEAGAFKLLGRDDQITPLI